VSATRKLIVPVLFHAPRKGENVKEISTDDLFSELKRRSLENEKAIHDLALMTRKFEELNEKLRQVESYKSNFLSNVRSEINSPLAVILALSDELSKGLPGTEAVAQAARMIYNEAFELDFQLKNISVAAEIEVGESTIDISRIDVVELIKKLVDSFKQKSASREISIEFTFEQAGQDKKQEFHTDVSKLSCIVVNLLDNAIKFNNEGDKILVIAEKNDGLLSVSISDDGSGIAEKDRRKVFERFVQIDTCTIKHRKGQGLGLSVSKALAKMLDGKVTFSCPSGKGCVFTLTVNEADGSSRENSLSEVKNPCVFDDAQKY
jgi:signal transduction histidine kinase